MSMNTVEKEELSDALITLQLCNYNNPVNNQALKACATSIRSRLQSAPVRELMQVIQISPQPLRSIVVALQKHRPHDLKEGTLSLN